MVPSPPTSTAELLEQSAAINAADSSKYGLALLTDFYHPAGYLFGWGGQIFDDTNHSAFGSPETISFLNWIKDLTSQPGIYQQRRR